VIDHLEKNSSTPTWRHDTYIIPKDNSDDDLSPEAQSAKNELS